MTDALRNLKLSQEEIQTIVNDQEYRALFKEAPTIFNAFGIQNVPNKAEQLITQTNDELTGGTNIQFIIGGINTVVFGIIKKQKV